MIITKTPFRVSFAGGGSDMAAFYREEIARYETVLTDDFYCAVLCLIKKGGILSITVPARESTILMNHIHYFDAGRLIRYLLFAGFDCRNAEILEYGYNLSLILPNVNLIPDKMVFDNEASHEPGDYHDGYGYDDMEKMFLQYMPIGIKVSRAWDNAPYFVGDIKELNWKGTQLSSF